MPACTFFGHRDCPETIRPKLRNELTRLITEHRVDMFYIGNQGRFDALVRSENYRKSTHSIIPLSWHICHNRVMKTILIPCCRKELNLCIPDTPSPGEITGCYSSLNMWLHMLPTPGVVLPNSPEKQHPNIKTSYISNEQETI